MSKQDSRMWSGRFNEPTDAFVEAFTASVSFDQRMAMADIQGSLAHAKMLHRIGLLDDSEQADIEKGLEQIRDEINNGSFEWSVSLEDVHMNIESRLTQLVGNAGKKLHTGRSRNDQVATDIRLYLRGSIN
ncbi:MAG: lyase family protein, partial [Gammaproteobacteria bacterium]|nr:lyase family protein [Gammaproteobacteria bacterium]